MQIHRRTKYALALGRFQPLHLQHLTYLLATAERADHLIVGITNPTRTLPPESPFAPHRTAPEANPFSYFDRYRMIRDTLVDADIPLSRFTIVPAALGSSELLDTLPPPTDLICCITINDIWGKEKQRMLEEAGIEVEVMWERIDDPELITGTMIRQRISDGQCWEALVPEPAGRIVREILTETRGLAES